MKKVSFVYQVTKVVVDIVFLCGIVTCFFIPMFTNWWVKVIGYSSFNVITLNIVLITSGVLALFIIWQMRRILKGVVNNNPFTDSTINSLRKIAVCSVLISIIYIIKLLMHFTLGTFAVVVVFLIATLLFLTLKDLFKQALYYKEENEGVI